MNDDLIDFKTMAGKFGITPRTLMDRIKKAGRLGKPITDIMPKPNPRQFRERYCWDKEIVEAWFKEKQS